MVMVWQELEDNVTGTGTSTQFTDTVAAPARPGHYFYELRKP